MKTKNAVLALIASVIAAAFILIGGWMIGSASYNDNQHNADLQISCLKAGGIAVNGKDGFQCLRD